MGKKTYTVEYEEVAHYEIEVYASDEDEARALAETYRDEGEYLNGEYDRDIRIISVAELGDGR